MSRYPLSDWRTEQLRLTVFHVLGATTRSETWWEETVGSPPDLTTSSPKKSSSVVAGLFGPGKLLLQLQPDRIDWRLVLPDPTLETGFAEGEIPNIGPVTEVLPVFSELTERWLSRNDVPDLARVAFGAVLVHDETDRRSAYVRLPDYVPVRVDPESSDFIYQINRRLPSRTGIPDLQVNRLSKWSVVSYKLLALNASGEMLIPRPAATAVFALQTELDINTVPEFAVPIPRARLIDVYRELMQLGCQVATEGIAQE